MGNTLKVQDVSLFFLVPIVALLFLATVACCCGALCSASSTKPAAATGSNDESKQCRNVPTSKVLTQGGVCDLEQGGGSITENVSIDSSGHDGGGDGGVVNGV